MKKIAIVGCGYVGLVTGAGLARTGHSVTGIDIDEGRVKMLKRGRVPFHEKGLTALVRQGLKTKLLRFTTVLPSGIKGCRYIMVAVATPPRADGAPDLRAVRSVIGQIVRHATRQALIIVKSTVPVGCFAEFREIVAQAGKKHELVSCPEFLAEGTAVKNFFNPDRMIAGASQPRLAREVLGLFKLFKGPAPKSLVMSPEEAQLVKYTSNVLLAQRVSYINTIADLCERIPGVDVHRVAEGVLADPRFGKGYLSPGVGYSGACLPKDLEALIYTCLQEGVDVGFLRSIATVNAIQLHRVVRKICDVAAQGDKIAVLGIAFKAGTSDVRCSRPAEIIRELVARGRQVVATDPVAINDATRDELPGVELVRDPLEAARGARCLAVLTGWPQYRRLNLKKFSKAMWMINPTLFDGPGLYKPAAVEQSGLRYIGIGRTGSLATVK